MSGRLPQHTLTVNIDSSFGAGKKISDCGMFALAFVTSVCYGIDPATKELLYNQKAMREHLQKCLEDDKVILFPSIHAEILNHQILTISACVYCTCRLPFNGKKIVEWSDCQEWFPIECISIVN